MLYIPHMEGMIHGIHEFFTCKVMGRERIFLFLVLPFLLMGTLVLLYFLLRSKVM